MRVSSLRLRLLLIAALTIGATLAFGGLTLRIIFERHVERRVADELRIRWDELAAAFTLDAQGAPALAQNLSDPRYKRPLSGAYWQIADAGGPRLRSRSLWDQTLPSLPQPSSPTMEEAFESTGPKNSEIYTIEREVIRGTGADERRFRLAVALDHDEINGLSDSFAGDAALALTALGVLLLIGAAAQAAIGLRPLGVLRDQLAAIQAGRSTRMQGKFPDEVAPLVSSLNLLLEQQEGELGRARERAGDLAHGLKTPLTILAGEARRLDEAGQHDGAALLREQVAFMRAHVERELARARTRGASAAGGTATAVAPTVGKLVGLLKRVGRGADLAWVEDVPSRLQVRMDPHDFGEVLGNLLDNARKWAGSRVTVSARATDTGFLIAIEDDGPGIAAGHEARMVEWGERGSLEGEGSGIGLAIVNNVLASYRIDLTLASSAGGGCAARFEVEGWIAPAEPVPAPDQRSTPAVRSPGDRPAATNARRPAPQPRRAGER